MLIEYLSNSRKSIQQTFIILRVHQYALIEQSAKYAYILLWHDALHYSNRLRMAQACHGINIYKEQLGIIDLIAVANEFFG